MFFNEVGKRLAEGLALFLFELPLDRLTRSHQFETERLPLVGKNHASLRLEYSEKYRYF